jgi:hypothetical protein
MIPGGIMPSIEMIRIVVVAAVAQALHLRKTEEHLAESPIEEINLAMDAILALWSQLRLKP